LFPVGARHQDPPLPSGVIPAYEYGRHRMLRNIQGNTPTQVIPTQSPAYWTVRPVNGAPVAEETVEQATVPSYDGHTRMLFVGTTPAEVVSRMGKGRRGFRSDDEELGASGRPWVVPPPPRLDPSPRPYAGARVAKERTGWRWSVAVFAVLLIAVGIALIASHR
jgi:hypothetical protein